MLWIIFPVLSSLFYSISSVIQNYLADMAFREKRAGAYVGAHIPTFVFSILLLLIIFGRAVFMLPLANVFGLIIAGAINVIGSVYYYKALQMGDTVDIAIFSEAGPLISLGLGVLILNQSITANQALAFVFIMAATILIIFSNGPKKDHTNPNLKVVGVTLIATFFSVLSDVIYIYFLGSGTANYILFAQSFFYFQLGSLLAVILGLFFFESWRIALKRAFKDSKKRNFNFLACFADNIAMTIAEVLYKLGLIFAPILALLSVVGNVAKLVSSFALMIFLGKVFPKLAHAKRLTKKMMFNYLIAGLLIAVGVMMVNGN